MNGLVFEIQSPIVKSDPNRADIACFVGFVGRRNSPVSAEIKRWLQEQGWTNDAAVESLLDLPVPIDRWEVFDRLFAWDRREYGKGAIGATYLGAAVRAFFAQGGRKCYIVRVGDPWSAKTPRSSRLEQIRRLIPGYPVSVDVSPVDRRSWSGIGHLFGLPDVSFLCLPDLADAVAVDLQNLNTRLPETVPPPEEFVECSTPEPAPLPDNGVRFLTVPRCDRSGYEAWASALNAIAQLINAPFRNAPPLREIQLVAAVPIPQPDTDADRNLLVALRDVDSAFIQLVYPWLRTPGSVNLPQQLESPEGVLAGILARNALTRGAFRSTANLQLAEVQDIYPILTHPQIWQRYGDNRNLLERVSLFGMTPSGLRLLSDVTTSLSESYRPASVNRLIAVIIRAARLLGEEIAFEASGELLWAMLRDRLNSLMLGLFQAGALQGNTPAEAFRVICDRSTMTQSDLDSGRVIAQVQFAAAVPIEQITVFLAMNEGGQISLLPTLTATQTAA